MEGRVAPHRGGPTMGRVARVGWLMPEILIVDDEPDILETVVELLSSSEVITADNFDDACKLIEAGDRKSVV